MNPENLHPKSWQETTLGSTEVAEIIMGQSPDSSSYNADRMGIPFFQGKADFGNIYPEERIWCSSPIKTAEINDILMSVRAPVGDVNINKEKSCIGRGVAAIRSTKKLNYMFLFFFLKNNRDELDRQGTGTTFKSINKTALNDFQIILPPLPEQKKIAAVLFKIQQAIETQEKILSSLRELKKSTMEYLFSHGTKGEKTKQIAIDLNEIPLSDLGEIITGTTPPTANQEYYTGGGYQFIAPNDIGKTTKIYKTDRQITEKGLTVSRILPKYSVCFVCIGSTIGKVGITISDKATTNQQINSIVTNNRFDPFYVTYLLDYHSNYIASFASPSPVPILSKGKFAEIPVKVTFDKTMQTQFAYNIRLLDDKIELCELKKNNLNALFNSMLNKLMTREIRVNNLDIDVSEITA